MNQDPQMNGQEELSLTELNDFLGKAALSTYAGGGTNTKPQESGFIELPFAEGDFEYQDSYTGFYRSFGHEIIKRKGEIIWSHSYGGGMVEEYIGNKEFAIQTFDFLIKALSTGEKRTQFQPRGQEFFEEGDWRYESTMNGDIQTFKGREEIFYKGNVVFYHDFFGGLVINK